MEFIISIFIKALGICIGLYNLKGAISKMKKPMLFIKALEGYAPIKQINIMVLFSSVIITTELLTALLMISVVFMLEGLILFIFVQAYYLINLVMNINKNFVDNCGCFGVSIPATVTFKELSKNLLLFLLLILLLGIMIRFF